MPPRPLGAPVPGQPAKKAGKKPHLKSTKVAPAGQLFGAATAESPAERAKARVEVLAAKYSSIVEARVEPVHAVRGEIREATDAVMKALVAPQEPLHEHPELSIAQRIELLRSPTPTPCETPAIQPLLLRFRTKLPVSPTPTVQRVVTGSGVRVTLDTLRSDIVRLHANLHAGGQMPRQATEETLVEAFPRGDMKRVEFEKSLQVVKLLEDLKKSDYLETQKRLADCERLLRAARPEEAEAFLSSGTHKQASNYARNYFTGLSSDLRAQEEHLDILSRRFRRLQMRHDPRVAD